MLDVGRFSLALPFLMHTHASVRDTEIEQPCSTGSRASVWQAGCQPLSYLAPWSNMARQETEGFLRQHPSLTTHHVRIAWRSARPCATYPGLD
jgi:hypothetical protein